MANRIMMTEKPSTLQSRGSRMPRAMYKHELAALAGVSRRTFSRFLSAHQQQLSAMGVTRKSRLLPPFAVKYLAEAYCIELPWN